MDKRHWLRSTLGRFGFPAWQGTIIGENPVSVLRKWMPAAASIVALAGGGVTTFLGVKALAAQPPPKMVCDDGPYSLCAEGEFCFAFFCWDVEDYWEEEEEDPICGINWDCGVT